MKIKPLHNHVVIKQQDETETMYGNIVVPDMGKEKPLMGEVLAVGPGIYTITGEFIETKVKVGETVVFPAFGGTKMTIEGEEYVVMKENDLLATIEKEIKIALNKEHLEDLLEDSQKSLEKENEFKS
jgi:chaperonin GroES